jgi:hypothetical protein
MWLVVSRLIGRRRREPVKHTPCPETADRLVKALCALLGVLKIAWERTAFYL